MSDEHGGRHRSISGRDQSYSSRGHLSSVGVAWHSIGSYTAAWALDAGVEPPAARGRWERSPKHDNDVPPRELTEYPPALSGSRAGPFRALRVHAVGTVLNAVPNFTHGRPYFRPGFEGPRQPAAGVRSGPSKPKPQGAAGSRRAETRTRAPHPGPQGWAVSSPASPPAPQVPGVGRMTAGHLRPRLEDLLR